MITVHNIVAASATVGLLGREGDLIRKTILPTIYYCFLAGGLSLVAVYGFGANLSTAWLLVVLLAIAGVIVAMRRAPGKPNDELVEPGSHHDDAGPGFHFRHGKHGKHGDHGATSVREPSSGTAETDLGPDPTKGGRGRH
jgi:lactate permease